MLNTQPNSKLQTSADKSNSDSRSWLSVLASLVTILVCSQLFALDWTGSDGWWLSWISMAGFVLVVSHARPVAAAFYGLTMGLLGLGASFWWAQYMLGYVLNDEGYLPKIVFAALIAWESLIFVVVGCSIASQRRSHPASVGIFIPMCVWIAIEAYLPRVFRWTLGHSQLGALPLVQTAELGGPSTITILVLAAACIPTLLIDWLILPNSPRGSRARRGLMIASTIVVAFVGYGLVRVQTIDMSTGRDFRIGVIQEDPAYSDGISKMRQRSLSIDKADLLVWPESTLGTHANSLHEFGDAELVQASSKPPMIDPEPLIGLPAPLIVGGRSFDGRPDQSVPEYQTAFLLDADGTILSRYHKRSLMPLGEYVPGEKTLPWLHDWFQLGQHFETGKSDEPIALAGGEKIGVIICYEDTMAEVTRKTVVAGAQLLVCIINDSAFESPVALRQHLKLARLRAIEDRRYLVRCAGTGVSCAIDPVGNLHHELGTNEPGAFVANIKLLEGTTPFQLLGEWPPIIATVLVALALLREHFRARGIRKAVVNANSPVEKVR